MEKATQLKEKDIRFRAKQSTLLKKIKELEKNNSVFEIKVVQL